MVTGDTTGAGGAAGGVLRDTTGAGGPVVRRWAGGVFNVTVTKHLNGP